MAGVYRNRKGRWAGGAQAWARSRRRRQALGAGGRWQAAGASARGVRNGRARGAHRQLGGRRARGRAQQAWARGALGVGARGAWLGRWARGLGAWAGQDCALGAPDLIFKPVFDSVFFLSQ